MGVCSVAAPVFLMQPGMGGGIAASKTSSPPVARLRSLITHTVFGIGLYGAAMLWRGCCRCNADVLRAGAGSLTRMLLIVTYEE
ncbi:MAG TPA: DUF2938 family protein [Vineibacter sp.]|nr:DUF2938 family protein [Vineibacter sp.]